MDVADFGEYFSLQQKDASSEWRSLRDFVYGSALHKRVDYVASALAGSSPGGVEPRVAASTMSLGLFARVLSPIVGAAVLNQPLPNLNLDFTYWRLNSSSSLDLAITGTSESPSIEQALSDVIHPLANTIGKRYSLSEQVLRGNISSAVFGAIRMITLMRTDLEETALKLGKDLLDGPLSTTGSISSTQHGPQFVRSSCCLYYRVPGGGYCGDCVLIKS